MKRKLLTETPVCPRERLVIISYTTGLSFAEERIGPLTAIVTTVFYLLALYLLVLPNTPENLFASIYSESLIKTTHQHLLLLVGFDTLIYRKYYDTPPILVGHQKAIASELHRLENAGYIREIKSSTWVSNPVIVPKKNTDVQRVCVDYTSLNKHCPKDPFSLPRIDQIID
jgi:hypothetical protein